MTAAMHAPIATADELAPLRGRGTADEGPSPRTPDVQAAAEDAAERTSQVEGFEQYVARRRLALVRTAYLLTGDRETAEDLVQTALARVWLAWPRIRDAATVDAYVRRTLVNTQRSFWRRRRVQEIVTASVPEPLRGGVDEGDAGLRDVLWAGLAELPRKQRATLVLRYYEDLSEAETARALGVSVGTVKSNASRGLARLRDRAAAGGYEHLTHWDASMQLERV